MFLRLLLCNAEVSRLNPFPGVFYLPVDPQEHSLCSFLSHPTLCLGLNNTDILSEGFAIFRSPFFPKGRNVFMRKQTGCSPSNSSRMFEDDHSCVICLHLPFFFKILHTLEMSPRLCSK